MPPAAQSDLLKNQQQLMYFWEHAKSGLMQTQTRLHEWNEQRILRGEPFDDLFLNLSSTEKRALLRKALRQAVDHTGRDAGSRVNCPEVRVEQLLANNGRPLLALLESLVAPNKVDEVVWIKNERFDYIIGSADTAGSKAARMMHEAFRIGRQSFINYFLRSVALCIDQKYPGDDPLLAQQAASFERKEEQFRDSYWSKSGVLVPFCIFCGKTESSLKAGEKLQRCSKCRDEAQRDVWYCSRECQTKAWKAVHKKECGQLQLSGFSSTFADTTSASTKAPAVKTHSSALRTQLDLLATHPENSWYFFFPNSKVYHGIVLHDEDRIDFVGFRDRAIAGDRMSVAEMYGLLEDEAERVVDGLCLTAVGLKKQLGKEFGVDVDEILREMGVL